MSKTKEHEFLYNLSTHLDDNFFSSSRNMAANSLLLIKKIKSTIVEQEEMSQRKCPHKKNE